MNCDWCGATAALSVRVDTAWDFERLVVRLDGGLRFLPCAQVPHEKRRVYLSTCPACSFVVLQVFTDTGKMPPIAHIQRSTRTSNAVNG